MADSRVLSGQSRGSALSLPPSCRTPSSAHLDPQERLSGLEVLLLHDGVVGTYFELTVVLLKDLELGRSAPCVRGGEEENLRQRFE